MMRRANKRRILSLSPRTVENSRAMPNVLEAGRSSPSTLSVNSIIESWQGLDYLADEQAEDTANDANEITIFFKSLSSRREFERHCEVAKSCIDEAYMAGLTRMLYDFQERNQEDYPFVIFIAPSGSGKTTLAYNLCMTDIPTLYFVYSCNGNSPTQTIYRPFQSISEHLIKSINEDLRHLNVTILKGSIKPSKVDTFHLNLIETEYPFTVEYRTVDYICTLFEEIFRIRRENPGMTWLDAQTRIQKIKIGKISIAEGSQRLDDLRESEYCIPLVGFVDEAVLKSGDRVGSIRDDWKSSEIIFLRTILRLLNVLPCLAGTEATSSDFCGMRSHCSRVDGVTSIWCGCIRDLPGHSRGRFQATSSAVRRKFGRDANIETIINYLESSSQYENPLLIDFAFDFLLIEVSQTHDLDLCELLELLLIYVFRSFVRAKQSPELFTDGQVSYIFSYSWKEGKLIPNLCSESTINRHLGQLAAESVEEKEPHFYLQLQAIDSLEKSSARDITSSSNITYSNILESRPIYVHPYKPNLRGQSKKDTITVPFEPSSTFVAFKDAPFTGLVLFGLNSSMVDSSGFYQPFVSGSESDTEYFRRPSIEAVIRHTLVNRNAGKEYWLSGKFLECLYTTAALVASRANGLTGCPLLTFLVHFIRELTPSRTDMRKFFQSLPVLELPKSKTIIQDFKDRIIPLVSPMAVNEWPADTVELLQKASSSMCRLGTFWFSDSNDPVDNMILELDLERNIETTNEDHSNEESDKSGPELDISFREKAGKKYCNWGKEFTVEPDSIKSVSLIGECKLRDRPYSLMDILNLVVLKKFCSLGKGIDCRTFITFVLKTTPLDCSPNNRNSKIYYEKLHLVNGKGFHIWFLKKKRNNQNSFQLREIDGQLNRKDDAKDVIVVSLKEIVGEAFVKSLHP